MQCFSASIHSVGGGLRLHAVKQPHFQTGAFQKPQNRIELARGRKRFAACHQQRTLTKASGFLAESRQAPVSISYLTGGGKLERRDHRPPYVLLSQKEAG